MSARAGLKKCLHNDCISCGKKPLSRDETAICMKLLGRGTTCFFCFDCLAVQLECEAQDLLDMIEEFKAGGCTLFA